MFSEVQLEVSTDLSIVKTRDKKANIGAEEIIVHSTPGDTDKEKFMDKATGLEMEQVVEPQPLLEWFAEKYKEFGATLEFVTNKSQEGSQFVKGFGGIGGILRYKVAFEDLGDQDDENDEFYGSDEDSGMSPTSPPYVLDIVMVLMSRHLMSSIGQERPAQRHARRGASIGAGCRCGSGGRGGSRGCTSLGRSQTRLWVSSG